MSTAKATFFCNRSNPYKQRANITLRAGLISLWSGVQIPPLAPAKSVACITRQQLPAASGLIVEQMKKQPAFHLQNARSTSTSSSFNILSRRRSFASALRSISPILCGVQSHQIAISSKVNRSPGARTASMRASPKSVRIRFSFRDRAASGAGAGRSPVAASMMVRGTSSISAGGRLS